jgi:hypothetical protein
MDYNKSNVDLVRRYIMEQLSEAERELSSSKTLRERISGCEYILKAEDDEILMLKDTNKTRRAKHGGTPIVGGIRVEEDRVYNQLALSGGISLYCRASSYFERAAHATAHRFNIPILTPNLFLR